MSDKNQEQGGNTDMTNVKWDDQYDNPDSEIILISNDKVGFRVDTWFFKKKSEFIRNLVDVPSQEPLDHAPIHLDYSSTTIRPFVHHIYSNTAIDFEMTTRVCKELFELCDRFQALQIYDLTCRTMQLRLENSKTFKDLDVWEIFRLAALKDDVKLAKSAIAAFDSAGLTQEVLFTNNAKSRARFEGLPVRYVHAILMGKCTRDYMYNTTSPDCDMEAVWRPLDSKTIARDFKHY